jgi:hypothetical protein
MQRLAAPHANQRALPYCMTLPRNGPGSVAFRATLPSASRQQPAALSSRGPLRPTPLPTRRKRYGIYLKRRCPALRGDWHGPPPSRPQRRGADDQGADDQGADDQGADDQGDGDQGSDHSEPRAVEQTHEAPYDATERGAFEQALDFRDTDLHAERRAYYAPLGSAFRDTDQQAEPRAFEQAHDATYDGTERAPLSNPSTSATPTDTPSDAPTRAPADRPTLQPSDAAAARLGTQPRSLSTNP